MQIQNRILLINNKMEIKTGEKFQWIKGDNIGDLEVVADVSQEKIRFESGKRLMKSVFNEFVKPIKSQDDLLLIQKADNDALKKQSQANPPASNVSQKEDNSDLHISKNKIAQAVEKSRKETTLSFKLNFNYLDTSLYDFLKDNHEDFDEIYQDILFEQMKSKIKHELKIFLNNTYKSE